MKNGQQAGNSAQKRDSSVFERIADSQPILSMLETLSGTGRKNFNEQGAWEVCLCALVLRLEPNCKVMRLLESLPGHTEPMDDADFLNTMAHLGYYCRPADSGLEDIDERLLPGVFIPGAGFTGKDPFIVLGRDSDHNLLFYDPVSKLVSQVPPAFDRDGKVWFFQKYDENRAPTSRFMRKGTGYTWFRALIGRFGGTFIQVMAAGLILNLIALATPLFIMLVYDRVISAGASETLPMLVLGALVAIGFEWKLRDIRSSGLSWLAGRLDNIVGNKIFSHLVGLSPDLIERASVAAQIARIKTFESVRDFFSGSVFLSLLEAPYVFLAVAAIAFIAGPLVFVPLFMVTGYIGLFFFIRQRVKVAIRLAAKASSARQLFTIETFDKLDSIRGHGLDRKWQEKFRHLSGREMMAHFHLGWLGMVAETCAHALTIVSAVLTIAFGVEMIWSGQMSAGALVATMILVWRILTPFYSLCTMIPRLEQLRNSIIQVNDLMDIETEVEEARSHARLQRLKGGVSFHNVSFRYESESDDVFSSLSFEIKPGDVVAITGGNGSGKSAVLKLIKALHHPGGGVIRIDGFDIRQLDAPNLRRQIGYVPKIPCFFHGSILENVRIGNPLATEGDVRKALEQAAAWEDVCKQPKGLDSFIGGIQNSKLTPDFAAKLSLARAYLNPSSILLMDILPNSVLSGKTGNKFKEYLSEMRGKQTIIFCSYRDDYIQMADTVVCLRAGSAPVTGSGSQMIQKIQSIAEGRP